MEYRVTGTFEVRMRGSKKVTLNRIIDADSEQEAIDSAVETEISLRIYDWVDVLNVEIEDDESLKAIDKNDLPVDVQMAAFGPEIAPTLF